MKDAFFIIIVFFVAIARGSIVWSLGNPRFKAQNAKTYTENPRKVDENTARASF